MDPVQALLLGLVAMLGSVLGSMLGLGGGIIIIPLFTLYLDVDPKIAVAASAVSIVTNSVVGSQKHLFNRFVNVRLAMILEITTAIGAIVGAIIAVMIDANFLRVFMGLMLLYAAFTMLRGRKIAIANVPTDTPDPHGLMAQYTERDGSIVTYLPQRLNVGIPTSGAAGVISGMLGIGGGVIQVPLMNLIMKVPLRAASGTSSFMIGMTGVASAFVYWASGTIDPRVTIPAMLGVFLGSNLGSILTRRLDTSKLSLFLIMVMVYLGISMLLDALGISLGGLF